MADCDLASNDDVFCLKRGAENVVLTRSRLRGRLAAPFKIGTETDGLFRDIEFSDSTIEMSDRAAICLESVDGAEICNVRVERIKMNDVNVPIFIRLGARDSFCKGCGTIRDITIADIEGYGDTRDEGYGSCIAGVPERCVQNVTLRDLRFTSRGGQPAELAERRVPELPELYPEFDMFGRLPAHGLYARHVRGLSLERVEFSAREPDGRPAIALEDVEGVHLVDTGEPRVRGPSPPAGDAGMREGNTTALLEAIRAAGAGDTVTVAPGDYAVPRDLLPIAIETEGITLRSEGGAEVTRIRAVGARENEWKAGIPRGNLPNRGDSLIVIRADKVTVSGFSMRGAFHNIRVDSARACCIQDNRFEFAKRHQVYCHGGGGHRLAGNTSTATNNNAFKLDECHDCTISGNRFERDPAAIRLTSSCRTIVEGNRFMSVSWHGVMIEDGANRNTIRGNLFADGRLTGIQVRGCDNTEILENEFHGHKTESVMVDTGSGGVVLRRNSFHDNHGTAVSNETENPVDATENWWGSPDGPRPGTEVDKNVLVDPWLTEPPATWVPGRA